MAVDVPVNSSDRLQQFTRRKTLEFQQFVVVDVPAVMQRRPRGALDEFMDQFMTILRRFFRTIFF